MSVITGKTGVVEFVGGNWMPFVSACVSHWKARSLSIPCDAYDCAASDIELNSAIRFACEYAKKTPVNTMTISTNAIRTSTSVKADFALQPGILIQIFIRRSDHYTPGRSIYYAEPEKRIMP